MRFHELLEAAIPSISPQQSQGMFGPLYHGTREDLAQIIANGFDISKAMPRGVGGWRNTPLGTSNGYSLEQYGYTGVAPPVHHLGFGVYMTTMKAVAKKFAGDTVRGMRTFYLDSQRIETINFGAPNTMMRWWREHGYDMTAEATKNRDVRAWIAATMKLTLRLAKDNDAVWFTGKSYRGSLLDGDQVCIYQPDLIRVVDPTMATGLEVGAKVVHTQVIPERYRGSNRFYVDEPKPEDFGKAKSMVGKGWRGVYRADEETRPDIGRYPVHWIPPAGMVGIITPLQTDGPPFSVKWTKGGEMYNYAAEEITPAPSPKTRAKI